jgi:hypothetical protein
MTGPLLRSEPKAIEERAERMRERHRQVNRDSMRRRRAERALLARQQQSGQDEASADKKRAIAKAAAPTPTLSRRCAICRTRDAVEDVIRLLPRVGTRSGYVQVRIPYCGCC